MNGTYFKNSDFPSNLEYNEPIDNNNILFKKNVGKKVKIYATFPNSKEWRDRMLSGIIEGINNNFLIISDPKSGAWYLLPIINISYIEFEEKIN